jgi:hypothetical protein
VAVLRHRRAVPCRLAEIPVVARPPILKSYLEQVPGARPHVPVSRHAAPADFEPVARSYPVFRVVSVPAAGRARRHHWPRWVLGVVAAIIAAVIVAAGLFVKLQPSPAALTLPAGPVTAPAGPLDGRWEVSAGSLAGFRVRESAFGIGNYTVGRTSAVTGTVVISGDMVTSAVFQVDLTAMKVGGKSQPQFADSLGSAEHPVATVTLTEPATLGPAFAAGATVTTEAAADFTMHGASHRVLASFSVRRDGLALQAAGSIPVTFSVWGIRGPAGFGFVASLASHGIAEFFLLLRRG